MCAQHYLYETQSTDSNQSTQTTQEIDDIINYTNIDLNTSNPRHIIPVRVDNKAAERSRLYRLRHRERINQRRREIRHRQQKKAHKIHSVSNVQNTDQIEHITQATCDNQLSSTLRQQRYYDRHKDEINKRKRDSRRKQNSSRSIPPATGAERNRKYRERNRQDINKRRRDSRHRQQNEQRRITECVSKENVHIPSLWYFPLMDSFLSKNEQTNRSGFDNIEDADSESETSQPSTSGRSNKRKHNDMLLQLAKNILAPKVDDEFTNFANNIASQLKRLKEEQNIFAQKLISDVIFYARTDSLNRYTTITNLTSNSFLPTVQSPASQYSSPTSPNTSKAFHSPPVSLMQREFIRIQPQEQPIYTLTSVTSPILQDPTHNLIPQQQQRTQYLTEEPLREFIEIKHEPVYDQ